MEKLFVYGTLGPGRPNEHILKEIGGTWKKGFVRGKLFQEGWGAEMGFPGIRLRDEAERINGHIFYSNNLGQHWSALDDFEGKAYQRVIATVIIEDTNEEVEANIYTLK